jgi:hypothetical protein
VGGYPKFDYVPGSGKVIVLKYYAMPYANILNNLPAEQSLYPAERVKQNGETAYTDYILQKIRTYPDKTNKIGYAELSYHDPRTGVISGYFVRDKEIRYEYNDDGLMKSIETHPKYKTYWNYELWYDPEQHDSSVPAWHLTAVDKTDIDKGYAWVKSGDGRPEKGWEILEDAGKPGVDSYIVPAPIVTRRQYFKNEKEAAAEASRVGETVVPGKTYGLPDTPDHWLQINSTIVPEDGWYVVTTRYQYADEWDYNIYIE